MKRFIWCFRFFVVLVLLNALPAMGGDLDSIRKSGVLRHLGIPYASFVTGAGDGMDVELIRQFAKSLGVRYEYVKTDWDGVLDDLIGRKVKVMGGDVEFSGDAPVRGDLVANGFTILPWRQKLADFSRPSFPSQIWLIARANSKLRPIKPTGNIEKDIAQVKRLLHGRNVLALEKTCLDPALYNLSATGAHIVLFKGKLNEMAPAIIKGEAEMTILDAPDALVAMEKWPGKMKIIGPISPRQEMGVAFPKSSPKLREAFDIFLAKSIKDGSYMALVKKYYPTAPAFFPEFFRKL